MKEIICLFIGQAGIQIGESILENMNIEHNIGNDGIVSEFENQSIGRESFYINVFEKKFRPRFLFIDLDPMTIDVFKNGKYKHLCSHSNFIKGKEDCSNVSVKGYYTNGKEIIENTLDKIRIFAEGCKSLEGFIIFHSISGGTGSGFTSLLTERLSINYGKKMKISFCIFPSKSIRNNIVEPFNSILSVHSLLEHLDVTNVLTNQSLYSFYEKKYHLSNSSFKEINSVISEIFSNFSMNFRQSSQCEKMDLWKFSMNMVPYPRISFLFLSHSKCFYNINSEAWIRFPTLSENIKKLFSLENSLTRNDLDHEKLISCSLFNKGYNNYFELLNSIRTQKDLG
jgi:tubulin alpha